MTNEKLCLVLLSHIQLFVCIAFIFLTIITGTYIEAWKHMGDLVEEGIVRDIGISNFFVEELEKLWVEGKRPLSVVQNWLDPYYQDRNTREITDRNNIVFQAYSILGTCLFRSEQYKQGVYLTTYLCLIIIGVGGGVQRRLYH